MRSIARFLSAACIALTFTATASAQSVAVVGTNNQFGFFNLSTRAYTQVSASMGGASDVRNIAFDGSSLFITDRTAGGTVLRTLSFGGVASSTRGTIVSSGQADEFMGLAFRPGASTLYSIDYNTERLVTINPANAAATPFAPGVGYSTFTPISGQLAFVGSTLFGTINTDTSGLYSFNTTTGVSTFIGNGGQASLYGNMIAFSNGSTLYGINGTTVYQINTLNGALSSLGLITGANVPSAFYGAVVIPEPGTVALVTVAAGLALAWRVRSRRAAAVAA